MRMSKKTDKEEEIDRWFIDDEDDDDEEEVYNKENEWSEEDEEDENESDEDDRVLDENDLTQIPGVDLSLAKRLKREGYNSLWEISMVDIDDLIDYVGITRELAEKMITGVDKLLGITK